MAIRRGEINLYVTDLDRSLRFYSEGLGMTLCESDATFRKLQSGDVVLTLFVAKDGGRATPPETRPSMTCDLIVEDLEATAASLRAAGGEVAALRAWEGGRWTQMTDPDGIGWELIEAPTPASPT